MAITKQAKNPNNLERFKIRAKRIENAIAMPR